MLVNFASYFAVCVKLNDKVTVNKGDLRSKLMFLVNAVVHSGLAVVHNLWPCYRIYTINLVL